MVNSGHIRPVLVTHMRPAADDDDDADEDLSDVEENDNTASDVKDRQKKQEEQEYEEKEEEKEVLEGGYFQSAGIKPQQQSCGRERLLPHTISQCKEI